MGIAAQLGEVEQLREIGLEIGKEVTGHAAIMARRAGSERGREGLDTRVKDLPKSEMAQSGAPGGAEPRRHREILWEDQPGLQRMARGSYLLEQVPEREQVPLATARGQGRILFAEESKPAEQMGLAAQLGELEHLREIGLEIGEETTSHAAVSRRAELQVGRESLDTGVKNLTESELGQWGTPRLRREILGKDQAGLQRMARGGQVAEQAAENDQVDPARTRRQRRILFAQGAEPAEQMGIAAQLGELEQLREIRLEISEEAMDRRSIGAVGSRKSLDAGLKDLLEFQVGQSRGWGRSHTV
jgi:hypothetical protein